MTHCATCRWLHDHAKGQHWARWLCLLVENHEVNPVTGELEPYKLCRFINYGACEMWEAGRNCLSERK